LVYLNYRLTKKNFMPEIEGIEKLFSIIPKKRFSVFRLYGTSQLGRSHFGDEDIFLVKTDYGVATFGVNNFADIILLSGIYRTDNVTGKTKYYREPFYITKNPRTEVQQAWRGIFADAVAYWQGLTTPEKEVYNIRAKGRHMSGYNLCLQEYLKSH
jgi:hypothetical protein